MDAGPRLPWPRTVQMGKRDYAAATMDVDSGDAAAAQPQDTTVDVLDVTSARLVSPGASSEDRMQTCALLASSTLPLETILSRRGQAVLPTILAWMAADDIALAAEAASVLRAWTQEEDRADGEDDDIEEQEGTDCRVARGQANTRRLYAHQVFPHLLSLFSLAVQRLGSAGLVERTREELVSLEHWIGSLLLVVWAILELIPAALNQLPESPLGPLAVMLLERAPFLPTDEARVILLRCLLCACERHSDDDGLEVFASVDRVRLEAQLERIISSPSLNAQLRALSFALRQTLGGAAVTDEHVRFMCQLVATTSVEGHLVDVFEILANYLVEVPSLDRALTRDTLQLLLEKIAPHSPGEAEEDGRRCLQRALSCLVNLVSSSDELDRDMIQSLWTALLGMAQSAATTEDTDAVAMLLAGRALRNSLASCHADGWYPSVTDAKGFASLVAALLANKEANEEIVSTWASLPAIVLPDLAPSTIAWYQQLVIESLFRPDRSVGTVIAAVEIVERLASIGVLTDPLRDCLKTNIKPIRQAIRKAAKEGDEEYEEELAFIGSTLESIV